MGDQDLNAWDIVAANRKASVRIHIHDLFDYEEWTKALEQNRSLEHVTMAVSVPSLGCMRPILDFFRALGRLPKLQRLQFSGAAYCWRLPFPLLLALLENSPKSLATLHIQDVEFRGSPVDVQVLAKYIVSNLPSLKHFSLAHCRFQAETSKPVLDPLVDAVLASGTLEQVFLSATRVNALGGPVSRSRLREIFANRRAHSPLKELRLMKFRFSPDILAALFGTLIVHHPGLEKLLLSSCQWDLPSVRVLAQLIRNGHHNLREIHLLGDCTFFERSEESHLEITQALQTSEIRRFFIEPLNRHTQSTTRRRSVQEEGEEEGIPLACQNLHVQCLERNYNLEEFRLAQPFQPEQQGLVEFYLRLNRAGRRTVCFQQHDGQQQVDSGYNKEAWVNAIIAINDDVSGIAYFLGLNPSLCAAG